VPSALAGSDRQRRGFAARVRAITTGSQNAA
jgi:hypothetical protein